jgi:hypothetical protein
VKEKRFTVGDKFDKAAVDDIVDGDVDIFGTGCCC